MKIIDFHMHIKGGDRDRTEATGEEIIKIMDRAGIERSVVFSICISAREGNLKTYKEVKKFPDRLIGFATGIPAFNTNVCEEIERAVNEYGFKGVKVHRGIHTLEGYLIFPLIEKCIELDIPCLIDCCAEFEPVKEIVKNYPSAKIVVAHLGGEDQTVLEKLLDLANETENLYFDTSYVRAVGFIGKAIEKVGSKKLIFGSDGPLIPPEIDIAKINFWKLTEEEKEDIFYNNAKKLLKI
ncbi:MAG: amidohydrolase family protein [bacterium]|nr:amidohydrolase family protein [bacterium]